MSEIGFTQILLWERIINKMNTILALSGEIRIADLAHSAIPPDLIFNSLKEIKLKLDELYQQVSFKEICYDMLFTSWINLLS